MNQFNKGEIVLQKLRFGIFGNNSDFCHNIWEQLQFSSKYLETITREPTSPKVVAVVKIEEASRASGASGGSGGSAYCRCIHQSHHNHRNQYDQPS